MQTEDTTQASDPLALLSALAPLVEGDGARLELVSVADDERSLSLRLVLDGVDCLDCVMPRDYLEALALKLVRAARPAIERVVIDDPREHSAAAAAQAAAG